MQIYTYARLAAAHNHPAAQPPTQHHPVKMSLRKSMNAYVSAYAVALRFNWWAGGRAVGQWSADIPVINAYSVTQHGIAIIYVNIAHMPHALT